MDTWGVGSCKQSPTHINHSRTRRLARPLAQLSLTHIDAAIHQQGAKLQDVEEGRHQQAHVEHLGKGGEQAALDGTLLRTSQSQPAGGSA